MSEIPMRPSAPEKPRMSTEHVRVVEAVSPKVSFENTENGVRVTVKDINGTHVTLIPERRGPQGVGITGIAMNADYTLTITLDDGSSYTTPSIRGQAGEIPTDRITTLDGTPLAGGTVLEAVGIPEYIKDVSGYSDYGLTESGWYIFAQIAAKDGVTVTAATSVTGAAGVKMTPGAAYIDVAVKFGVAAASQSVTVDWGENAETFVFKATDLAVRNLDYMARFYVYDIAEYCTWTYALTTDTKFVAGNRYFTLADGVYTEAIEGTDWTAGADIPADTYYKHSKLHLEGMTQNVTYKLNEKLDCPLEIALPEVVDEGHGAWYEIQMNYSATWSCTLLPPTGVKIGTAQTQAQSAGINVIDLQYTDVDGVKIWTLLNTHSNVPA